MEKITSKIYLGGISTKEEIERKKIKYVINLSTKAEPEYKARRYKLNDNGENTPKDFIKILRIIDEKMKEHITPIYISCRMGKSRSVVITSLYLYYSNKFNSFDAALKDTMHKVPAADPNHDLVAFVRQEVVPLLRKGRQTR
jgi:protein-tyrosine phosphatase